MLKTIANSIVSAMVGVVSTFILTFIVTYFTGSKGELLILPPTSINGEQYVAVSLNNYSDKIINDVIFTIPNTTELNKISATDPIQIQLIENTNEFIGKKQISISGFKPRGITQIFIPIVIDANSIQVINLPDKNISLAQSINTQSQFEKISASSLRSAAVYFIVYLVFAFWFFTQKSDTDIKIKELKEYANKQSETLRGENEIKIKELNKLNETLRREMENLSLQTHQTKILLLARLNDYAKELSFWRDTIRKILYDSNTKEKTADVIIQKISESLKTYHTLEKSDDFKTIEVLSRMLSNNERIQTKIKDEKSDSL
jgi:cell division protein FtsB